MSRDDGILHYLRPKVTVKLTCFTNL